MRDSVGEISSRAGPIRRCAGHSSGASCAPTPAARATATSRPCPHARPGREFDTTVAEAVKGLRGCGYSWAEIGARPGITAKPRSNARERRLATLTTAGAKPYTESPASRCLTARPVRGQAVHRDSSGPGSSVVFRVSGKEREEVASDVPQDADDAAGRQGCGSGGGTGPGGT